MTTHCDRLKVLGTHHCPQAAAPGSIKRPVHDAGVTHHVFAGFTDHCSPHTFITQFGADHFLRFFSTLTPQFYGIFETGLPVNYREVYRLFGFTLNDHAIKSGGFQFGSPEFPGFGFGNSVC